MYIYPLFHVGDKIDGYCNGYFGRDDYEPKHCVISTQNYCVFEYEDGTAVVVNKKYASDLDTKGWLVKE